MTHNNITKFLLQQEEKRKSNTLVEQVKASNETYVYIKAVSKYYWVELNKFFNPIDVCNNLMISNKQLQELRQNDIIKDYDNLTYRRWGKDQCYNLLDEFCILAPGILPPGDIPNIPPDIKTLIESVAGNKKENIDYLHKAILYKYLNVNDYTIPAIVLYGKWWSGKWTLMSLLGTMFWNDNILANLWQRDLSWNFDTYRWQKLVVEFAEITTNNTNGDKSILNKLKNVVGAEKLTINEKWVRQYQIDNIAWFFISSNSNKPLQLDDKDKGNRRFTIFKSNSSLSNGEQINKTIRDKKIVAEYITWLLYTFPEVKDYKKLTPLDNEDKRELEDRGMNEANQFWEWLNENYPEYTWKKSTIEINLMITEFCVEHDLNMTNFMKYFWNNSLYPRKKLRIGERTFYWVDIPT